MLRIELVQFKPDDMEAAAQAIQSMIDNQRVCDISPLTRIAAVFDLMTKEEPKYLSFDEGIRTAIMESVVAGLESKRQKTNDRHACQVIRRFVKSLRTAKKVPTTEKKFVHKMVRELDARLPRILPAGTIDRIAM